MIRLPARFRTWGLALGLAALLALIQVVCTGIGREYYLTQLTMSGYYAMVAMGLCLLMGYTGQVSLGHAAFFAVGGYTSARLTTLDLTPWLSSSGSLWETFHLVQARTSLYGTPLLTVTPAMALIFSLLLSAVVALLVGYPSLRLKGHYLAMATLGFGLIVYRVVLGTEGLGAADGITAVPGFSLGGSWVICEARALRVQNFYMVWTLVLLLLVALHNLIDSRVGRALRAIHGHEIAAASVGIDTAAYKLQVFVLSAVVAALAGSLFTHYTGGIGPSEAGASKSVRYVALVAAGGMANLTGCLVASTVINFLSLRGCFGTLDHAVFGILLIVIISWAPEGPLQPIARAWVTMRRRFTRQEGTT